MLVPAGAKCKHVHGDTITVIILCVGYVCLIVILDTTSKQRLVSYQRCSRPIESDLFATHQCRFLSSLPPVYEWCLISSPFDIRAEVGGLWVGGGRALTRFTLSPPLLTARGLRAQRFSGSAKFGRMAPAIKIYGVRCLVAIDKQPGRKILVGFGARTQICL